MPKTSEVRWLSLQQRMLLTRVIILLGLTTACAYAMTSVWLINLTNKLTIAPTGEGAAPLLVLGIALLGIMFMQREKVEYADLYRPSVVQIVLALLSLAAVLWLVFLYTHPSQEVLFARMNKANTSALYGPVLTSMYWLALLLPFFPIAALIFSGRFLKEFWQSFAIAWIVLIAFLFSSFVATQYHALVLKPILIGTSYVLRIFSTNVQANTDTLALFYKDFSVIIGPACSGFRSTALFTLFFGVIWYSLTKQQSVDHIRALMAYVGGVILLFFVNIIRVASIMLIGSRWPDFGIGLFHGSAGFVFLLIVFLVYLKLIVPWLRKKA